MFSSPTPPRLPLEPTSPRAPPPPLHPRVRFFEDEIKPTSRKHDEAGLLSMANMGVPDSNGSQFFFSMRGDDMQHLDGKHTVFAKVEKDDKYTCLRKVDKDRVHTVFGKVEKDGKHVVFAVVKKMATSNLLFCSCYYIPHVILRV